MTTLGWIAFGYGVIQALVLARVIQIVMIERADEKARHPVQRHRGP